MLSTAFMCSTCSSLLQHAPAEYGCKEAGQSSDARVVADCCSVSCKPGISMVVVESCSSRVLSPAGFSAESVSSSFSRRLNIPNRFRGVDGPGFPSNLRSYDARMKTGVAMATIAPSRPPFSSGKEGEVQQENIEGKPEETTKNSTIKEETTGQFTWKEHWYPVSLIEDLETDVPTPFQILGREIVVWKDKEGSWRAFVDKCPHRLAPLSEGRIDENGWLQCSYHGWSFKSDGSCGIIPQAAVEGAESKARFSPRACATVLPTFVSDGLLFVWPDDQGWEKALKTEPPRLPPAFSDPEFAVVNIQRDLFYGYDTLMENVSDPSHIDFAHHKVTGRRDRAKPIPFKVEESGYWGFKGSNSDTPKITAGFLPPAITITRKTRSIVCSARNFFQFTVPGPEWWKLMPRWFEHWTSNKVYDGDMIVLQGQEKAFGRGCNFADVSKNYTKLTFTPTQADRFVLAFRNWLKKHGKGQPEWFPEVDLNQPLPSTVLSKRTCSSCRKAVEDFRLAQKVLWGATVVLAAGVGVPPDVSFRLILAVSAVISAGAAFLLKESEKNFIFKDYVHAKID